MSKKIQILEDRLATTCLEPDEVHRVEKLIQELKEEKAKEEAGGEEVISEEMIHMLKTEGITMCWEDGREQTVRITEAEAEQLRQGKPVKLARPQDS